MSNRPQIPLSLCLIVKNEALNIKKFAKSLDWLTHPDDEVVVVDTGSTDGTAEMMRKRIKGCKVIERGDLQDPALLEFLEKKLPTDFAKFAAHGHYKSGILRSFAEARNIGFEAAKNKHLMWLDLDDVLVNGATLRKVVDTVFAEGRRGALFLKYDYTISVEGDATTVLWRERVVTKGDYVWKGECHETLIPVATVPLVFARDPACPVVVRHVGAKEHQFSDLRNYAILYNEYKAKGDKDPRTLFYLGNAARGLGQNAEAIQFYHEFCPRSGNPDDIMAAKLGMAGSYAALSMFHSALKVSTEASVVNPADPRPHYMAANIWANIENWLNCITETQIGDNLQMPDTLHACEPHMLTYQPQAILATALRELGRPQEAMQAAKRARAARPNSPEVKAVFEDFQKWANAEMMMQEAMRQLAISPRPQDMMRHMLLSPHFLPKGIGAPEGGSPGTEKGKKTIAFWCGTSHEPWGPASMQHGIGASEKMVYDVSKALAKLGWNVQVYCTLNCEEGTYEGVHWSFTARFDPRLYRDIVVVWRVPVVVSKIPFQAGKLFIWMHDVGDNSVWTPEILMLTDKVLFLSAFQRSLHPAVPDDKVYITRNGVDIERHKYTGLPKQRNVIFCSSPDRGFLSTVRAFRQSKIEENGWKLHLFYGFGKTWRQMAATVRYQHIPDLGRDCDVYAFADMCAACCDGEKVIGRGRVGWEQMAHEMKTGSIWLYPTVFDEISCVSAMEAMAAGSAVVSTLHGALGETCRDYPLLWAIPEAEGKADMAAAAADLREAAAHMEKIEKGEIQEAARFAEKFDVKPLVDNWCRDLFNVA